jgi:cobalt transporter subunit CbtA
MIFQRLIWSALAAALLVGSVQTGVQRWQAAPLIFAAEVYEEQKAQAPEPSAAQSTHVHAEGVAPEHAHDAGAVNEWEPENGAERIGWTWVANVLHAFSMALLVFAVMGLGLYQRGAALASLPLAAWVAAAGWLSFHFLPSLGLHAEVPGMDAAPLQARQLWWVLAVGSAVAACGVLGWVRASWRWAVAAVLLALPFVVGAPHLQGDALAGFGPPAHAALEQLGRQFIWATTWVSLSFWVGMGVACGLAFERWLRPALLATFELHKTTTTAPVGVSP